MSQAGSGRGKAVLLLAGLGYGVIEADVDRAALPDDRRKE